MRDVPAWKRYGYSSLEAWIESKAGASPPRDWPFSADAPTTPPDDEGEETPDD
jgi:hypothetical protein